MKISGFTFVKNAVKFYYPIVESIKSILPLCDEFIVNVGLPDEDGTLKLIQKNIKNNKLKIIKTEWDPQLKVKQRIFAQQTNIALQHCKGDWCFYIQGDEVVHAHDHEKIFQSMKKNLNDERVEGLVFDFLHFFGGYKTYIKSYHWYRKEIRIIRNHLGITSFKDAQGFRVDGKKLWAKETGARIFHYGWVRPPEIMLQKKKVQDILHHKTVDEEKYKVYFEFVDQIDPFMITEYTGTHPQVMEKRIKEWKYVFDKKKSKHKLSLRDIRYRISDVLADVIGYRMGEYRNFKLMKK